MADVDSVLVSFQRQLSDVMETVVKTAMYEVSRLVEDSLLQELRKRSDEVHRLKAQLQRKHQSEPGAEDAERAERGPTEALKEEEERHEEDFNPGGHTVDDTSTTRLMSKPGPILELETTANFFRPLWGPQTNTEDPVKLIDNIKKEAIESTSCSALNLEEWRVTIGEVHSESLTAGRKAIQDKNNGLVRHINPNSQICASFVDSYEQQDTGAAARVKALDKNTNWFKMTAAAENDSETSSSQTSTHLESKAKVTPSSPSPSCNVFGVAIKQEVVADSEAQTDSRDKAMPNSERSTFPKQQMVRTAAPKQNRISHKSFVQVLKAKGGSSFRLNSIQRPIKRPPTILTNSSTTAVNATHSQGLNLAPPSSSLSVQRTNAGDKHVLNRSGAPWISIKSSTSFHSNPSLNVDSRLDGPRPIFRCGQCGKCFPHPSNLKSHLLTHSGERPFCCGLCGRTFTKLSNLKAHRRVHTGERPYSCASCGKRFTQNCNLKRHQRIHLDE